MWRGRGVMQARLSAASGKEPLTSPPNLERTSDSRRRRKSILGVGNMTPVFLRWCNSQRQKNERKFLF